MKTEDLIADLSSRATPVRPLASPAIRAVGWLAIASAFVGAGVAVFGARPDIGVRAGAGDFLWTGALALLTLGLAGFASLVLAVPGAERSPLMRGTILAVAAVWLATLAAGIAGADHGFSGDSHWYVCFVRVAAIGLIPAAVLFRMLRQAAPLQRGWTATLAMAAATAAGALAVQFICPIDDAAHALLGHLGPVLAFCALGAAAAPRLLRRADGP